VTRKQYTAIFLMACCALSCVIGFELCGIAQRRAKACIKDRESIFRANTRDTAIAKAVQEFFLPDWGPSRLQAALPREPLKDAHREKISRTFALPINSVQNFVQPLFFDTSSDANQNGPTSLMLGAPDFFDNGHAVVIARIHNKSIGGGRIAFLLIDKDGAWKVHNFIVLSFE